MNKMLISLLISLFLLAIFIAITSGLQVTFNPLKISFTKGLTEALFLTGALICIIFYQSFKEHRVKTAAYSEGYKEGGMYVIDSLKERLNLETAKTDVEQQVK